MKTVAAALREAAVRLAANSDTGRLDAELLMAHALGVSRSELLLRHMERPAHPAFAGLVERRARHEPVAYILGRKEFFGREFAVARGVLIPRMDSETTVEAALEARPTLARVLDCGSGSGALLLTVLAERPGATGVGIDRSPEALEISARNANRLALSDRAQWLRRDWNAQGWAEGIGLAEIGVFYRTNAQSRVLEDAFRTSGIPYHIVGSVRFYERKEVKDALAYLRLALNPADDLAFTRAIAVPPRGIGKATLTRLAEIAEHDGVSLLAILAYWTLLAALFGAVFSVVAYAFASPRREFTSLAAIQAASYEVLADEPVADRALRLFQSADQGGRRHG